MKNTIVLNKLMSFKSEKDSTKRDVILNGLINDLKAEIYSESCGSGLTKTTLQRNKKALSYLKKVNYYRRDELNYCDFQEINYETYQVFTNGWSMFMLKEKLELPVVADKSKYPQLERIYTGTINQTKSSYKLDVKDVLAKLKAKTLEKRDNIHIYPMDEGFGLNAAETKMIIEILGTTDLKVTVYSKYLVLYVNESTGDKAIQMPIRLK